MPERDPEKSRSPASDGTESSAAIRAKLARELDGRRDQPIEPPPIPDHSLLRCIGSGACGEVWLARNALGTFRAVKIVYRSRFKADRPYEREFDGILKYEPVSRTHDGLVQVLHVGRNDEAGFFYYVMELADAEESPVTGDSSPGTVPRSQPAFSAAEYRPRTLRSELGRRQRLPPVEAAQFALRLARSLEHLHDQGLVHRDIKPSNIIFVSGQPKLADIGLVTDIGSSQSFVGTEGFIPPEGPGTRQADLYGLGKLLYELAAGRDRMDFPQLPAGINQLADGEAYLELNEVITRACAPDPRQRYATAAELQAELNLFLAGRSLRRTRAATNFLGIPYIGMLYQPDGRTVWLAKDTRTAGLYDLLTLEPILFLPTGMVPLALSPDGSQLAVSVDAQRVALWDLEALRQHFRELGVDWAER